MPIVISRVPKTKVAGRHSPDGRAARDRLGAHAPGHKSSAFALGIYCVCACTRVCAADAAEDELHDLVVYNIIMHGAAMEARARARVACAVVYGLCPRVRRGRFAPVRKDHASAVVPRCLLLLLPRMSMSTFVCCVVVYAAVQQPRKRLIYLYRAARARALTMDSNMCPASTSSSRPAVHELQHVF